MKIIPKNRPTDISVFLKKERKDPYSIPILKEDYSLRFLLRFDSFVYTVFVFFHNANSLKRKSLAVISRCIPLYT